MTLKRAQEIIRQETSPESCNPYAPSAMDIRDALNYLSGREAGIREAAERVTHIEPDTSLDYVKQAILHLLRRK